MQRHLPCCLPLLLTACLAGEGDANIFRLPADGGVAELTGDGQQLTVLLTDLEDVCTLTRSDALPRGAAYLAMELVARTATGTTQPLTPGSYVVADDQGGNWAKASFISSHEACELAVTAAKGRVQEGIVTLERLDPDGAAAGTYVLEYAAASDDVRGAFRATSCPGLRAFITRVWRDSDLRCP